MYLAYIMVIYMMNVAHMICLMMIYNCPSLDVLLSVLLDKLSTENSLSPVPVKVISTVIESIGIQFMPLIKIGRVEPPTGRV